MTRQQQLEVVRKRMPEANKKCPACWDGRVHSDEEWKFHYNEGRGDPMGEPPIRRKKD